MFCRNSVLLVAHEEAHWSYYRYPNGSSGFKKQRNVLTSLGQGDYKYNRGLGRELRCKEGCQAFQRSGQAVRGPTDRAAFPPDGQFLTMLAFPYTHQTSLPKMLVDWAILLCLGDGRSSLTFSSPIQERSPSLTVSGFPTFRTEKTIDLPNGKQDICIFALSKKLRVQGLGKRLRWARSLGEKKRKSLLCVVSHYTCLCIEDAELSTQKSVQCCLAKPL